MEGSASVRKSLSGTLVPLTVTTVALLQQPEEKDEEKLNRKVLDEEQYIEVRGWQVRDGTQHNRSAALARKGAANQQQTSVIRNEVT